MTDRIHISRRQFLKTGSITAGCSLLGLRNSWAEAAGNEDRPNILFIIGDDISEDFLRQLSDLGINARKMIVDGVGDHPVHPR